MKNVMVARVLAGLFCLPLTGSIAILLFEACHAEVNREVATTMEKYDHVIVSKEFSRSTEFYVSETAFKSGTSMWSTLIKPDKHISKLLFMPFSVDQRSSSDWLSCQLLVMTDDGAETVVPVRMSVNLRGPNIFRIISIRQGATWRCHC